MKILKWITGTVITLTVVLLVILYFTDGSTTTTSGTSTSDPGDPPTLTRGEVYEVEKNSVTLVGIDGPVEEKVKTLLEAIETVPGLGKVTKLRTLMTTGDLIVAERKNLITALGPIWSAVKTGNVVCRFKLENGITVVLGDNDPLKVLIQYFAMYRADSDPDRIRIIYDPGEIIPTNSSGWERMGSSQATSARLVEWINDETIRGGPLNFVPARASKGLLPGIWSADTIID